MPSIETQNVQSAAAAHTQQQRQDHRVHEHKATPQQVSRASEEIADRTTITHREDRQRATQVERRTEAAFATQETKRKPKAAPEEAEREPKPEPERRPRRVNVKA